MNERRDPATSERAPLALIVAVSEDGVIGKDGGLPWHISEDLKHFKRTTLDHAVIMGRKTYESIGRPLPRRRFIVVTRDPERQIPGCEVCNSLDAAIDLARQTDPMPFVIGGASLYEAALPLATVIHRTKVQREVEGDTFFPPLRENEWRVVEQRQGAEVIFEVLHRIGDV
jgi:dihydrofolate reductase